MQSSSTAVQNRLVNDYLVNLASLLPSSSAGAWASSGGGTSSRRISDGRLSKLVELAVEKRHSGILADCTDLEVRVLLVTILGRANAPQTIKRFEGDATEQGTRPLTAREAARDLGLTYSQYRRVMTSARKSIEDTLSRQEAA